MLSYSIRRSAMKRIVLLLVSLTALTQEPKLERILTDDAVLFVKIADAGKLFQKEKTTGWFKLMDDPEYKEFLKSFKYSGEKEMEKLMQLLQNPGEEFEKKFGMKLDDAANSIGEIAAGIANLEGKQPPFVVSIQYKEKRDFVDKLFVELFSGFEKKTQKINGMTFTIYDGRPECVTTEIKDRIYMTFGAENAEMLAKLLTAPPSDRQSAPDRKTPLAESANYKSACDAVAAAASDFLLYVSFKPVLAKLQQEEEGKKILDLLPSGTPSYLAISFTATDQKAYLRSWFPLVEGAAPPKYGDELFNMSVDEVKRDRNVLGVSFTFEDMGAIVTKIYDENSFFMKMFSEFMKQAGMEMDFSKFPKKKVAEIIGKNVSASITTRDGMYSINVSDGGLPMAFFTTGSISSIAVIAALSMPAIARAQMGAKETMCANNLKQLGLFLEVWRREKGAPQFNLPDKSGRALWNFLRSEYKNEFPEILLVCPVSGLPYRGPADAKWNAKKQQDAIGMCASCGNVLLKSYAVVRYSPGMPEYEKALEKTSDKE